MFSPTLILTTLRSYSILNPRNKHGFVGLGYVRYTCETFLFFSQNKKSSVIVSDLVLVFVKKLTLNVAIAELATVQTAVS
jgi:hypothetical protein